MFCNLTDLFSDLIEQILVPSELLSIPIQLGGLTEIFSVHMEVFSVLIFSVLIELNILIMELLGDHTELLNSIT